MNTDLARKWRNCLIKATIINYVLLILCWVLLPTPLYPYFMKFFTELPYSAMEGIFIVVFGIWEVLVVVFFLIPAIVLHWEFCRKMK